MISWWLANQTYKPRNLVGADSIRLEECGCEVVVVVGAVMGTVLVAYLR